MGHLELSERHTAKRTYLVDCRLPIRLHLHSGTPVDRDALVAEAGLEWQASQAVSLGVAYQGQIGSQAKEHAFKGSLVGFVADSASRRERDNP